jgi:DNA-binding MarR family transcriptional regulator
VENEHRLSPADITRLLNLVSSLAEERGYSAPEAIDLIAELIRPSQGKRKRRPLLGDFAERIRRLRIRRNEMVGAPLFRDPAWDMLLALFSAHERGEEVSVSSLCFASGVPATTALRQVARLEKHGLVVRECDDSDLRREFIRPTARAIDHVSRVAAMLVDEVQALKTRAEPDEQDETAAPGDTEPIATQPIDAPAPPEPRKARLS